MWQNKTNLPAYARKREYLDNQLFHSSAVPNLAQDKQRENNGPQREQCKPMQTKQAWSASQEGQTKARTVIPFRRPGTKAPLGVPKLDLSFLGGSRDVFEPVVLLDMEPVRRRPAQVPASVPKHTGPVSTSTGNKDSTSAQVMFGSSQQPAQPHTGDPMHRKDNKTVTISGSKDKSFVQWNSSPSGGGGARLPFKCFLVTRNGRDVHRDLTGYFYPADTTLAIYELKQLAKKPSAFALFDRGQYIAGGGRTRGSLYTMADIYEGAELQLDPSGQASLPDSLRRQSSVHLRVTEVDHQARSTLMFEGKSLADKKVLECSLVTRQEEEQKENSNIKALQAAVVHRLRGRATRTLVGLGRHWRQEGERSHDKGLPLRSVQQGLRTYHVAITPEDLNTLWVQMDPQLNGTTSEHLAMATLIGGMGWARKMAVLSLFQKLDHSKTGYIKMTELRRYLVPRWHPDVVARRKTEDEVLLEIANLLASRRAGPKQLPSVQLIPWSDFEDYFEGLSIDYPDEQQFSLCVKKMWGDAV